MERERKGKERAFLVRCNCYSSTCYSPRVLGCACADSAGLWAILYSNRHLHACKVSAPADGEEVDCKMHFTLFYSRPARRGVCACVRAALWCCGAPHECTDACAA